MVQLIVSALLLIFTLMPLHSSEQSNSTRKPIVAVIGGTGYVGLVSGAGLASVGNKVICADIAKDKIAGLKQGIMPIYEPGLDVLVQKAVDKGDLVFTDNIAEAIRQADIVMIAVGTPMGDDGSADLRAFDSVANTIASNCTTFKVICTKSTVPVGNGSRLKEMLLKKGLKPDQFTLVSNPEFLREGTAIEDFLDPDRIVVGVESQQGKEAMQAIYQPFTTRGSTLLVTNIPTAETIKYGSNAFLAAKISFVNELAGFCESSGANISLVAKGMGLDTRIGNKFLKPGPGYGGSCFPKDCQALLYMSQQRNIPLRIVQATIDANHAQKEVAFKKLLKLVNGDIAGKRVAVLGLAFKPGTDDIRYSPSINLIQSLLDRGALVQAFDPEATQNMQKIFPSIKYAQSALDATAHADACVVMTEWPEIASLNLQSVAASMAGKKLVDMRGIFRARDAQKAGFAFDSIIAHE